MYCLHSAASPHLNRHPSLQHQNQPHLHLTISISTSYTTTKQPAKIIELNSNQHILDCEHKVSLATAGHLLIVGQESKLNAIKSDAITITEEDSCNHKKTPAQNPITGFWQSHVSAQTHKQQSKQISFKCKSIWAFEFCILNHWQSSLHSVFCLYILCLYLWRSMMQKRRVLCNGTRVTRCNAADGTSSKPRTHQGPKKSKPHQSPEPEKPRTHNSPEVTFWKIM